MIERLIKTPAFRRFFPPIAGTLFVIVFVSLGLWQLDRAAEKNLLLSRFEDNADFVQVSDYTALEAFAHIQVEGNYMPERQVLIDNIIQDGRPGYYVITPFEPRSVGPLLLVNRGWIAKARPAAELPDIALDDGYTTVRGLVGRLPRVAIRPGEAFEGAAVWPRVAVYPRIEEVANELDAKLAPIVLLLAPNEDSGYSRRWQPKVSGPSTHYGYAFQWFAMAATVIALTVWNLRKRTKRV